MLIYYVHKMSYRYVVFCSAVLCRRQEMPRFSHQQTFCCCRRHHLPVSHHFTRIPTSSSNSISKCKCSSSRGKVSSLLLLQFVHGVIKYLSEIQNIVRATPNGFTVQHVVTWDQDSHGLGLGSVVVVMVMVVVIVMVVAVMVVVVTDERLSSLMFLLLAYY